MEVREREVISVVEWGHKADIKNSLQNLRLVWLRKISSQPNTLMERSVFED